jgi:hypothetical protein
MRLVIVSSCTLLQSRLYHSRHDQAPAEQENGNPDRRAHHLENNVARHFEKRIRDEEQRDDRIVLQPDQFEVVCEASNFGISDCGACISLESV